VPLPTHVQDEIERAQHELRAGLPGRGIRWARRVQFHLTLRFLGEVESRRVDELAAALSLACRGFGALPLRARGIGAFPDFRRPRVIWAGVDDAGGRLHLLQQAVETAAAGFTTERPDATFTAHVTMGRCRTITRSQIAWLATRTADMEHRSFGAWTADTVDLVRSEPEPDGPRYTTLWAAPLAIEQA